jgi:uroporphyrinogen-III synthase
MRLLVTRPESDNERTAAELRARGHEVMLAPMLRVESVTDAELGAGPWAAVLITSANGARAIGSHKRRGELAALPVLAVGQASATAAREAGFSDVTSADGDGGDLARLAAARFAGVGKPLLYLSGEERARDLGGELAGSGLRGTTVVVYRTVKVAAFPADVAAALAAGALDGVVHFSRRSVESYLDCARDLAGPALLPVHYCLSARAAEPLQAAGASRICVAARPDEAGMLAWVTSRP